MNTIETSQRLQQQWQDLKQENPKLRIRNAAEKLGVSELELLLTQQESGECTPLNYDFEGIMNDLEPLGKLMALTRNEAVVHERNGVYSNFSSPSPHVALFVNPDIDLRIFPTVWKYACAVDVEARGKVLHSIQFFDKRGDALHKVYLKNQEGQEHFKTLVEKYKMNEAFHPVVSIEPKQIKLRADISEEDTNSFQEGWRNLKDTHEFYGLFNKYKLTRLQCLELSPEMNSREKYAEPVSYQVFEDALRECSKEKMEIMMFVGNDGIIQIHTGPIKKLVDFDNWFNVMDPDFNLHLNRDEVKEVWSVIKPTEDGYVSSFEVFNHQEELILQVFGKRKPGIPEIPGWHQKVLKSRS